MLSVMGGHGPRHREASPRSGAGPARARPQVRPLVTMADNMQIYKYVSTRWRSAYGKTATLHAEADLRRQRLGHACPPVDLEGRQPDVRRRQLCRSVAIRASITSAASSSTPRRSTPSPTRPPIPTSAWCRATRRRCCSPIPRATARPRAAFRSAPGPKAKRVEVRFPDPAANPYLAYAALLMAGLDGIENKIHPGDPIDKNLYDLPPEELKEVPTGAAARCARRSSSLDKDRDFLKKGGVFTDDVIDAYHRAEDGRSGALRDHPPSGRVRHVLQRLTHTHDACRKRWDGRSRAPPHLARPAESYAFARVPPWTRFGKRSCKTPPNRIGPAYIKENIT